MGYHHDFVAGQTALVRTGLKREILLIPISVGFLCSVVLVGMYFIGIVLQLDNVFSAQYLFPFRNLNGKYVIKQRDCLEHLL